MLLKVFSLLKKKDGCIGPLLDVYRLFDPSNKPDRGRTRKRNILIDWTIINIESKNEIQLVPDKEQVRQLFQTDRSTCASS